MSANPWFNSPYYHVLYDHRNEDEAKLFIRTLLKFIPLPKNPLTLDMACGSGRHSRILASEGHRVTGIDLADNSIMCANENAGASEHYFVHDMRNLLANNRFHLVVNLFTSIGYAKSDYNDRKIISNAFKALQNNGYFVIDYFNASFVLNNLQTHGKKASSGLLFTWNKSILSNRIIKEILVDDAGTMHTFHESVMLYSKDQLMEMLTQCGFLIKHTFGNYFCEPFQDETSERIILIAQKHVN